MYAKDLGMVVLLDMYGSLLSENRRNIMHLYYEEDLSLGEIAEMQDITRQAVYDSIRKSTGILTDTENKLHLASRFRCLKDELEEIEKNASLLSESREKENILKLVHQSLDEL